MPLPQAPRALAPTRELALTAIDGVALRGAVWAPEKARRGLALILTGRTEFIEKAAIPAAELVARGFAVASVDWRGQGLSQRLLDEPLKGHVGDFAEFHRDLEALLTAPEVAALGPPRLAVSHSMGGAIALGARRAGVLPPVPLVLSAPMLDLAMGSLLRIASRVTVAVGGLLGRLDRWPPFGDVSTPYVLSSEAKPGDNVLTADGQVFDWMAAALRADRRLQLAMPTLGWFRAATAAIEAERAAGPLGGPGLLIWGSRESVVDKGALAAGVSRLGIPFLEVPGALHELLVEAPAQRAAAWAAIDGFLAEQGL